MSLPSSDDSLPSEAASQQPPGVGRSRARQSAILVIAAVIATAAWGPLMEVIAFVTRPPQLSGSRLGYQQVAPYQRNAELRLWIILIASFLVILTLAMIFGRQALRVAANDVALARLRAWGTIALVVSLLGLGLGALVTIMPGPLSAVIFMPHAYTIRQYLYLILFLVTPVAAMSGFILNGIVAHRTAMWTWLSRVLSTLASLFWFLFVAFLAQLTVAFYMHLVG